MQYFFSSVTFDEGWVGGLENVNGKLVLVISCIEPTYLCVCVCVSLLSYPLPAIDVVGHLEGAKI